MKNFKIIELIGQLYLSVYLWILKRMADNYAYTTGRRQYIIRNSKYRYQIISTEGLADHNRRNTKKGKIDINILLNYHIYRTK